MKTAVILLVAVIICGSTFAVQYMRLQKAEAMCSALKTDLKAWQEAAGSFLPNRPKRAKPPLRRRRSPAWTERRQRVRTQTHGNPCLTGRPCAP